jgi:drug/metabolite transporter (DMT)-like permease
MKTVKHSEKMAKNRQLNPLIALTMLPTIGILWGLQFAMLKIAASAGYPEINVLMVTLVLLSLAFILIVAVKREFFTIDGERAIFILVTCLLGYVIPLLAGIYAAPHLKAGVLILVISLTPMVSISTALALRSERVSLARILAVLLGALSITLVLWPELDLPGWSKAFWIAVAFLIPLTYGIESVYIDIKWPKGLSALQMVAAETIGAMIFVLPLFLIFGDLTLSSFELGQAELAIGIFAAAGVIESILFFYLIRDTGGVLVSFGSFVSLFAGVAWGIILFSESYGAMVWLAVAVLAIALFLAATDNSRKTDVS